MAQNWLEDQLTASNPYQDGNALTRRPGRNWIDLVATFNSALNAYDLKVKDRIANDDNTTVDTKPTTHSESAVADSGTTIAVYTLEAGFDYTIAAACKAKNASDVPIWKALAVVAAYRTTGGAATLLDTPKVPTDTHEFGSGCSVAVTVSGNDVRFTVTNSSGGACDLRVEMAAEKSPLA